MNTEHYERLKMAAEFQPDGRLSIVSHETLIWAYEQVEKLRMICDNDVDLYGELTDASPLPEAMEERE